MSFQEYQLNNIKTQVLYLPFTFKEEVACFWLKPLDNQQKSFYKKAFVEYNPITKKATLYSYNTPILAFDVEKEEYRRLWSGWSATTSQHIKAFVGRYITKSEWLSLGVGLPIFTQKELDDTRGLLKARMSL